MSLGPPSPSKSKVGQVWVDPITAHRFVFTGENLDAVNYGWVPWDLRNEQYEYERGAAQSVSPAAKLYLLWQRLCGGIGHRWEPRYVTDKGWFASKCLRCKRVKLLIPGHRHSGGQPKDEA